MESGIEESCPPPRRSRRADVIALAVVASLAGLTIVGRMSKAADHKWLTLDTVVGLTATGLILALKRRPIGTAVTKMAREMHDVLAHRLSLLATYAGALEYRPDSSPEKLAAAAGVIRTGVHQALDELREVINVLRDEDVYEGRPQPTFHDLRALVAESREAGTTIAYDDRVVDATTLPPATGRTAYRIVQEGLTNARKHAAGQLVTLTVTGRPGDGLRIALTNPGANGASLTPGSGTGLVGLTERVQLAGGNLDHGKLPDSGFRLEASLPWPP
jgi:signal transduction histidine kinase